MNLNKLAKASAVAVALVAVLAGCQKAEGPAETAGKNIDNAVEKAGQQIEKTGDKIEDATKRDKP